MSYQQWLAQLDQNKPLPQRAIRNICRKIQQIFNQQSNLLRLTAPINVIGDVHGQFYDVLKIFRIGGQLPDTKYVFIGDFVDRGFNSLQTILHLFLLKILYPDRIYLTRGNHQSRQISSSYGFYEQIYKKYGHAAIWRVFNQTFDYLPLTAIIQDKVFCVHGGLSPDIHALDQIKQVNRVMEIPMQGPMADLMWSDPQQLQTWQFNSRGCGWYFGHRVVRQFNYHNNLRLIARAHQLAQKGYMYWFNQTLAIVWSAPNYYYRCGNKASLMHVDQYGKQTFQIFQEDQRSKNSTDYNQLLPYFL